jgi:predicted O-methyltransferase YrrM
MDITHPKIDKYLDRSLVPSDPILREMEAYGRERHFPIIGPQVGRLVNLLARSINAKRVLELGSGFGYSAMWFALAVGPDGLVVMTEGEAKNSQRARDYFQRAGLTNRAKFLVGNALDLAQREPGAFDVVFSDVDKEDYGRVLDLVRPRLRVGGLFICDNMLWSGAVLHKRPDAGTRGIIELTRQLTSATDFSATILPVRDGVAIALKLSSS